jgi:hypothetical protein
MKNLTGFRTVAWGLLVAIAVPGLTYLGGIDWTQFVNPNIALVISGAVTIGLRVVTTTSIFSK